MVLSAFRFACFSMSSVSRSDRGPTPPSTLMPVWPKGTVQYCTLTAYLPRIVGGDTPTAAFPTQINQARSRACRYRRLEEAVIERCCRQPPFLRQGRPCTERSLGIHGFARKREAQQTWPASAPEQNSGPLPFMRGRSQRQQAARPTSPFPHARIACSESLELALP